MAQAPDYSKCWANPLGDCAGGMTGEHHISRNQFGDGPVTVQGFPWCRDQPRTIGLDRLVANVLCAHHNNTSSPLDAAAGAALNAFQTIAARTARVKAGRRPERRLITRISGDRLERWLLKTTINLALQAQPAPTGGIFDPGGKPSRRFIDIVFGRELFGVGEGLTWVAEIGEKIEDTQHGTIRFQSWTRKEDGALVAAFVTFHGNRLWLATIDAPRIEHGLHPLYTLRVTGGANMRVEFEYSEERNRVFRGQSPRGRRRP